MTAVITKSEDLVVERQEDQDPNAGMVVPGIMITPELGPDNWVYRVLLSEVQAVIGFWKFGMIGVGFAVEKDWNLNLPHGTDPVELVNHIGKNRGDERITDEVIKAAVTLIHEAVLADGECECRVCLESK